MRRKLLKLWDATPGVVQHESCGSEARENPEIPNIDGGTGASRPVARSRRRLRPAVWAVIALMCLAPARAQSRESTLLMSKLDEGGGGGIDAMTDVHLTSIIRDRDRSLARRAKDIKKEMREIVTEPCAPTSPPLLTACCSSLQN